MAGPSYQFGMDAAGIATALGYTPANKAGDTFTGMLAVSIAGGGANNLDISGEGNVNIRANRYSADGSPPAFQTRKARGTIASPSAIVSLDNAFSQIANAYDGTTFRQVGTMTFQVVAATPSSTDMESQWFVAVNAPGSVSPTSAILVRKSAGMTVFGQTIVGPNLTPRAKSLTVTAIGALTGSVAGDIVHCSNPAVGNPRIYSYSGSNWYDGAGVLLA